MAAYNRVNLANIKDKLLARTAPNFWTEVEWQNTINEAIRIWQLASAEWTTTIDVGVNTTNTHLYEVPKQICSLIRVSVNGVPLTATTLEEMDSGNPSWQGVSGTAYLWAPSGLNRVYIIPYPLSGSITFTGFAEAPILGSGGDFIDIGDEKLSKLLSYAHHILTFKEGKGEFDNTMAELSSLFEEAGKTNSDFRLSAPYRRWMGVLKDAKAGIDAIGMRR